MGTQTHLPIKGHSPQFPSHVYFVSKWLDVSRPSSTWYGGRPRPRRHCVRWEPSFPLQKWGMPPIFGPCVLWANGRPSQLLLSSCLFVECLPIVMGDEKEWRNLSKWESVEREFWCSAWAWLREDTKWQKWNWNDLIDSWLDVSRTFN